MGYTPIELDKVRNFRYGMKAISLIEKKLKAPIAKIDMDSLTMEESATLVWAGLAHEDKNLTPDKVMDLIDDYSTLTEVMKAMETAMEEAFGVAEEPGKNE
ncbi:hypothetical protein Ami103574_04465 [Aminipila butyrica]|uniref:Tail assembly chaperone n=1 Tax=Aminipila butyrica TaxID=433296 RepID=A0A858BX00_9FIRM|nr:hypothetical protein [Aminipila butyrica]QIB68616.1 hypothetical protein Ami103574_04465 [Aminipila butyrica]